MARVSFVVPCFHSALTLHAVVDEILLCCAAWQDDALAEIVLVDDGSSDTTYDVIQTLCQQHDKIVGISLAKNFGQHAALLAGLRNATGEYLVFLDDDGQTPPSEADRLLTLLKQGYDAVYARYPNRRESLFRRWGSRINDGMARIMLQKPTELYLSSYFAINRFVANEIARYENPFPYVPGLVLRSTSHITNAEVTHRPRQSGKSGYSMRKLIALWLNGFTAFSLLPLRVATTFGSITAVLGFIFTLVIVVNKILHPEVPLGFSSTMSVLLFIGGVLMMMLGIIGEYLGRVYISINKSPQYVIRKSTASDKE